MKNLSYTLFFLLLSFFSVQGQKVRFYDVKTVEQYQQVLEEAMNADKMMFLVIYQDGDAFYRMQKDDVFANQTLATAYQSTIPLAVDIYSDMGGRLAESFPIDSLPSFLYLTTEEALVLVEKGYHNVAQLTAALTRAKAAALRFSELQKKYSDKSLTPQEWVELLQFHALNFSFRETEYLAVGFLNGLNNAQLLSPEIVPITATYGVDLETKYPKLIIDNRQKVSAYIDYPTFYESAYSYNFDRAVASDDTVLLEKIVTIMVPNSPDKEADKKVLAFETRKVFASETQLFSVWKRAALERGKSMEGDSARAGFLFEEAFEIADNFNSADAKLTARQLANAANKAEADFRYKMLESYMAYLMEDYMEADALVKEAKFMADDDNSQRKAAGLQQMIAKEMTSTPENVEEGSKSKDN